MKKITLWIVALSIFAIGNAQNETNTAVEQQQGHYNLSKFRQLNQELATPNSYRTASGSPGH